MQPYAVLYRLLQASCRHIQYCRHILGYAGRSRRFIYLQAGQPARLRRTESPAGCCGETAELEGGQPIINSLAHHLRHPKGIHEKEQFWLGKRRMSVGGCDTTGPCGSTKSWDERVRSIIEND